MALGMVCDQEPVCRLGCLNAALLASIASWGEGMTGALKTRYNKNSVYNNGIEPNRHRIASVVLLVLVSRRRLRLVCRCRARLISKMVSGEEADDESVRPEAVDEDDTVR